MKKLVAYIGAFVILLGVAAPAFAQNTGRGSGLIPCGVDANRNGMVDGSEECTYNDVIQGIQGLINFLFALTAPIATIMFAYAGWMLITADGDSGKLSEAKSLMTNVAVGFIIMLVAWLIVYTITTALIKPESGFTNMLSK